MEESFFAKVSKLQSEFTAAKSEFNAFGKYKYRNLENLLQPLKPLLVKYGIVLTFHEEVVHIESRWYVHSVAKLTDGKEEITADGFAREPDTRKGADVAQVTGGSTSYARKYALSALLLVSEPDPDEMMPESASHNASKESYEMAMGIKKYIEKYEPDKCKPFYANGKANVSSMDYEERKATLEALRNHFGTIA